MITTVTGVHKSTISRELRRNRSGGGHRHKQAHGLVLFHRQGKSSPCIDAGTWAFIETLIRKEWRPGTDQWVDEKRDGLFCQS